MITARGMPMEWREGLSLEDVVSALGYALPVVMVHLDGSQVPPKKWATTPVPDGSTVGVFPMMAGG